jgi:uncharacterized membrane protein YphA (DoxX/SURF4 family)
MSSKWDRAQPWVSLLMRVGLAGILGYAGWLKVGDLAASGRAVNAYQLMSYDIAMIVGAIQPFLELAVAALLLVGLATRLAAWISAVMLVAFIAGIASAWARGLNIDCGCFSKGGQLAPGETPNYLPEILRDIAFLAMAIFLIIYPVSRYSLDGRLNRPLLDDDDLDDDDEDDFDDEPGNAADLHSDLHIDERSAPSGGSRRAQGGTGNHEQASGPEERGPNGARADRS